MPAPFLAMITPIGGDGAHPSHPIHSGPGGEIGGPPGIWGGPWQPPYPSQGPGFPTNPIAGPGRPPWWGMAQDPGYGISSDRPTHPIYYPPYPSQGPGFPTNPIAGPGRPPWWGMAQDPGYGRPVGPGGGPPLVIWGPPGPWPTPPIALPPNLPPSLPPAQGSGGQPVPVEWKTGWSEQTGWVVVGVPTGVVPTPSSAPPPTGNPQAPRPA